MGYCLAPENLMAEFRKSHQFIVFTCNTPAQYGLAEYLKNEEAYLQLNDFYQQKRDLFLDLIKDSYAKGVVSIIDLLDAARTAYGRRPEVERSSLAIADARVRERISEDDTRTRRFRRELRGATTVPRTLSSLSLPMALLHIASISVCASKGKSDAVALRRALPVVWPDRVGGEKASLNDLVTCLSYS